MSPLDAAPAPIRSVRGALILAVVLSSLAALSSCSRDENANRPALTPSTAPTPPPDACPGKPKALSLDASYLATAKEQLGEQFPTQAEDEILEAIKKRHRHFLYLAFLDKFPESKHKAEVTCLMRDFGLFETADPRVVPWEELENKYNFFGTKSIARWNKGPLAVIGGEIIGAPLMGTLQFLQTDAKGGISVTPEGVKVPAGTKFIYPLTAPARPAAPAASR